MSTRLSAAQRKEAEEIGRKIAEKMERERPERERVHNERIACNEKVNDEELQMINSIFHIFVSSRHNRSKISFDELSTTVSEKFNTQRLSDLYYEQLDDAVRFGIDLVQQKHKKKAS